MSAASKGRSAEWLVRDVLRRKGYNLFRAAASKGPADLVAMNAWEDLVIAVRKDRWPPPAVRRALEKLVIRPDIRALVARTRKGRVEFAIDIDGQIVPVRGPLPADTHTFPGRSAKLAR